MHGELRPGVAVDLAVTKWEGTLTVVAPVCQHSGPQCFLVVPLDSILSAQEKHSILNAKESNMVIKSYGHLSAYDVSHRCVCMHIRGCRESAGVDAKVRAWKQRQQDYTISELVALSVALE